MISLVKKGGSAEKSYRILTAQEAEDEGLVTRHWRDAWPGDWVRTDDGYFARCLSRTDYGKDAFVRLSFCSYWLPRTKSVEFLPFYQAGVYGGTKPRHWAEREARKQRTKRTVVAYVQMLVHGDGIDWQVLGRIYRPDQNVPAATVRRLFKQPKIKELVRKELRAVLTNAGITEERVIAMYVDSYNTARDTGKPRDMIQVADRFREMLDMRSSHGGPNDPGSSLLLDKVARELEEEEAAKGLPE